MPAAAWRWRQGRRSEHAEDAAAVGVLLKSLFSLSSLWCTARLRRARRDGTSGVEPPARTSGRRGDWSGGGRGTIGHGDDGDGRQTRHDSLPPPMSSVPPVSPSSPRAPRLPRGGLVDHRLPELRRDRERGGGRGRPHCRLQGREHQRRRLVTSTMNHSSPLVLVAPSPRLCMDTGKRSRERERKREATRADGAHP